eukprot:m.1606271 g.1606271  ORF g.1606271 m.1606271 type:complete len:143 (+) comp25360_c0_seq2:5902-6330(+)
MVTVGLLTPALALDGAADPLLLPKLKPTFVTGAVTDVLELSVPLTPLSDFKLGFSATVSSLLRLALVGDGPAGWVVVDGRGGKGGRGGATAGGGGGRGGTMSLSTSSAFRFLDESMANYYATDESITKVLCGFYVRSQRGDH